MCITVAFRSQTERKCRKNKDRYPLFRGSEAEPLPHLIEFEAPAFFQFSVCSLCRGRTTMER